MNGADVRGRLGPTIAVLALMTGCHRPLGLPASAPHDAAAAPEDAAVDLLITGPDLAPDTVEADAAAWDVCSPTTAPTIINRPLSEACTDACRWRWNWTVSIDPTPCLALPPSDCSLTRGGVEADPLQWAWSDCHVMSYLFIRADYVSGCVTRVMGVYSTFTRPIPAEQVHGDCVLSFLAQKRWGCVVDRACSVFESDTLP